MPEDGQRVLCSFTYEAFRGKSKHVQVHSWHEFSKDIVTHWMVLPKPPTPVRNRSNWIRAGEATPKVGENVLVFREEFRGTYCEICVMNWFSNVLKNIKGLYWMRIPPLQDIQEDD